MRFIPLTKEEAKRSLKELVEQFEQNIDSYEQASYKESRVESDYIEKFFILLGWDVNNDNGYSELYRDVIKRENIEIEGHQKEADYAFTIGGNIVFFVEAKRPAVDIMQDKKSAYQIRNYAWNSKKPVSILTNFKNFSVYDCRIKPNEKDEPSIARIFSISFKQYIENFDFLYDTFSQLAVKKGALERYASKPNKAVSEVDDEFLRELEAWRKQLAKNIAINNSYLTLEELNYAVQKTLDRILFLRIAEDKNIETEGKLKSVSENQGIYKSLLEYFKEADAKYNSGIFDFGSDSITPNLNIDDKVLKEIIENLYYPKSPYNFKVINVEILGSAYERFLGNTLRLTASHQVKVEQKPEVRKAGGVYYTPEFVVDYIVKSTIGKIVEGKSPEQIKNVRILDMACGSGTFLVRAYQYLLDYILEYYLRDKNKYKNKIYQLPNNQYSLTTELKKQILLNNIFGVDIDSQAVEITKLSLLLKVLENETRESVNRQLKLFKERALPNLDRNIRCGNSIVDSSYFNQSSLNYNNERKQQLNPFDWDDIKNGFGYLGKVKFDVIIGNPPYVKEYTDREPFEDVKRTNLKRYYQGKMDLWYIFACKAIDLLKENGFLSYIALNNWITNSGASILRNKILSETRMLSFFDFNEFQVFKKKASNQTMVFVLQKESKIKPYYTEYYRILDKNITKNEISTYFSTKENDKIEHYKVLINPTTLVGKKINFINPKINNIINKIVSRANYFLNSKDVSTGIDVHQDFVIADHLKILKDNSIKIGDGIFVIKKDELKKLNLTEKEMQLIKPYYTTDQLHRYYGDRRNELWIIYADMNVRKNINDYPHIKEHLDKFKNVMTSDFKPYGLHRSREPKFFEGEKIMSLRKTDRPCFTYTDFSCYVSQTYFIIKPEDIDLKYLTGLLNSNLIFFWLKHKGKKQGNQLQVDKEPLLEIPIYRPDKSENAQKDEIIKLVDKIIALNKQKQTIRLDSEERTIEQEISAYENQIDKVIYKIYGLEEYAEFIDADLRSV